MFSSSDLNKIKNTESRNSFDNVLQAFYSNNYSAAILLLYNLLVNDLYYKLQEMDEKGYVNCSHELEEINSIIKNDNDSNYSLVEKKIFDTYKNKRLFNSSTVDLLEYFKKTRNKCAHPFYFEEVKYIPSKDQTYLFIKGIYSEILCVESFFKNPYEVIKNDMINFEFPDLESILFGVSTPQNDLEKVKKYYIRKYFKFMTEDNFKKLFKSLVELSIAKNSDEIVESQYKHYLILRALLEYLKNNNSMSILNNEYDWSKIESKNIRDDSDNLIEEQKCFSLSYLFRVISYNINFFEEIKDRNEDLFEYLNNSLVSKGYLFKEYWGLLDYDINIAIDKFLPKSSSTRKNFNEYYYVLDNLYSILNNKKKLDILKKMLSSIPDFDSYNEADNGVELLIRILSESDNIFSSDDLGEIFELMNSNCQIYRTSRNGRDNQIKKIQDLGYDLSKYDKLVLGEKIN